MERAAIAEAETAFMEIHAKRGDDGTTGRGIEISTDLSPVERRVSATCAVAKLNMGDIF